MTAAALIVLALGIGALLWWLARPAEVESAPASEMEDEDDYVVFDADVVGESHYQAALTAIAGGKKRESSNLVTRATLVLDDSNPYDALAVRIEIDGKKVGHLSRENARIYRQQLKKRGTRAATPQTCPALIRGGWEGPKGSGHFGVKLDLSEF